MLNKIAIVTDSSCDLREEYIKEYDITVLPFRIIYKNEEYLDKVTMSSQEMYSRLKEEIPTTSLPDLKYTEEVFERLKAEGINEAIVISVSSKLSGTLNSLRLLSESISDVKFNFFDSKTLGFPLGAITMEAAKLRNEGKSSEEIMNELESIRKRVNGYVTLDTLDYLIKGGRLGRVQGKIGQLLHLKPIVHHSEEGELYTYDKVRGRKQSIKKLRDIIESYLEKSKCRIWILQGDAYEEGENLLNSIKDNPNISEISLETIGASMGIHTGPGAVGVCILELK